ncbi:uncharacterized protein LOC115751019 isoform X2 [Rhodamnia argentea]|uniref:Uncharacterized protein LOC115751019 isoform X2 n=1 Tax=Rhodamnia argentea TaxID=178133 RepID=A0ABM3H966_9MYRT|nr:uncharacterized protein LOC115751019 isoform X2 [Rhodamnia argentea]
MGGVEWRKWYMDVMLVPLGFLVMIGYHVWLWHKDNEKKNILAVQTLRNTIMGSTLMATTSILLSTGLAAVISSTYSVKKPLNDAVYGAHGEFTVALKYVTLLTLFLFSFLCHSLSICFINQVNILINSPQDSDETVSPEFVAALLEKGFVLNTVGNRLFYSGLPLLLWIFGPFLVFLCSLTLVPILYNLDFVFLKSDHSKPNPKSISNTSATSVTITSTHFA